MYMPNLMVSHNTQFMVSITQHPVHGEQSRSCGNSVAHGSAFSLYQSSAAGLGVVSQKKNSYLQRIVGLFSKILRAWAGMQLEGPVKALKSSLTSMTLQATLDLQDLLAQGGKQIVQQPGPGIEPSLVLCMHTQSLQSCLALCDPIEFSPPGSSVCGILQTRILEWVAMPSSRASSRPMDQTHTSYISCIELHSKTATSQVMWQLE